MPDLGFDFYDPEPLFLRRPARRTVCCGAPQGAGSIRTGISLMTMRGMRERNNSERLQVPNKVSEKYAEGTDQQRQGR
jgi:hypothetical protein